MEMQTCKTGAKILIMASVAVIFIWSPDGDIAK
jgi:hypothetical protein